MEQIENIIKVSGISDFLQIKLYDGLPSITIHRAGNYLLQGIFLHGALSINTFHYEIDLNASDMLVTHSLVNNYEILWQRSRCFIPDPNVNWRSNLRTLFL